jgi:nitroreductase
MEFDDVIKRRRSVRRFNDQRPDLEVVDRVVDQARRAPTAGFSQGVDFLGACFRNRRPAGI